MCFSRSKDMVKISFLAISCVRKEVGAEMFSARFSHDSQRFHKIRITIERGGGRTNHQSYPTVASFERCSSQWDVLSLVGFILGEK